MRLTSVTKVEGDPVEMVKDLWKKLDLPHTVRIYAPITGCFQEVISEIEFEDFAQYEKFWPEVTSNPEWRKWWEKWATIEVSTSSQLLTLVE
jgi:hypothetical protein